MAQPRGRRRMECQWGERSLKSNWWLAGSGWQQLGFKRERGSVSERSADNDRLFGRRGSKEASRRPKPRPICLPSRPSKL
jgi:hypothetical protein